MPSILPPLSLGESLETTKIHSVAGKLGKDSSLIAIRPFRSPHHTISQVAMVGGGTNPQPGEISLAHNGLLFLDELPEFNRSVLEVLRQPLEDRHISIARAKYSLDYPASFMLVASMNPCPCGYYNHPTRACVCNPGQVQRYLNRISGPLLDRIDIQIEIVPVPFEKMAERHHAESSASIRERVIKAREIQAQRFANHPGIYCNAQMEAGLLHLYAQPNEAGLKLLRTAMTRLNLSARAYGRTDSEYFQYRVVSDENLFRIEVLIHKLQYIFYPDLLGISHRPNRIKLQTFCHSTFENKYRRSTGAGNQVHPFGVQIRNRLAEYTMMPCIHQSDAIRTNQ